MTINHCINHWWIIINQYDPTVSASFGFQPADKGIHWIGSRNLLIQSEGALSRFTAKVTTWCCYWQQMKTYKYHFICYLAAQGQIRTIEKESALLTLWSLITEIVQFDPKVTWTLVMNLGSRLQQSTSVWFEAETFQFKVKKRFPTLPVLPYHHCSVTWKIIMICSKFINLCNDDYNLLIEILLLGA